LVLVCCFFDCFQSVRKFVLAHSDVFYRYGDEVTLSKKERKRLNVQVNQTQKMKPPAEVEVEPEPTDASEADFVAEANVASEIASADVADMFEVCGLCQQENLAGFKFCCGCGKARALLASCGSCGAENLPGFKFCSKCGTKR
jgi:hypothetical protein